MPTYDYVCNECEHRFELFQQMTAPVETICPECGKPSLKRLVGTGAGIIFKGSGFYETDYRSDNYRKSAEADRKNESDKKDVKNKEGKTEKAPSSDPKPAASESSTPPKPSNQKDMGG